LRATPTSFEVIAEEWANEFFRNWPGAADSGNGPQRAADGFLCVGPGEDADTQISAFKIVDFAELV
jgi:hypothetical protein